MLSDKEFAIHHESLDDAATELNKVARSDKYSIKDFSGVDLDPKSLKFKLLQMKQRLERDLKGENSHR